MGYFLAVTGFRTNVLEDVTTAIADYVAFYSVRVEFVQAESKPDYRRDAQVYAPVDGWIVVLWPEYFNLHDFPLVRSVAAARNWLVSTVHVYDGEYWEHLCCAGSKELHAFCSRPHFWENDSLDAFQQIMSYAFEPTRLATVLGIPERIIQPYLVDTDTLSDPEVKAHTGDEFALGDFWVFVDFWRHLGISYPNPPNGLAAVMRLSTGFDKKLPVT